MTHGFKTPLDIPAIRADFPILSRTVGDGAPLVYLDNAATSQKPLQVINAMSDAYLKYNANVHRGIHTLSEETTEHYEGARVRLAEFINAPSHRELIYTRNTTESINIVAWTWGRANLKPGDVVISTQMEHHSNIVPWQMLAQELGFEMKYVPPTSEGEFDMEAYADMLDERVKLVTVVHMSNVLGTVQPVKEIARMAHEAGALVLVDGAQSAPHMPVDVQDIDCDFFVFSSHKMLGPTGIGVLWGKADILSEMPPFMGGGDMIREVSLERTTYNDIPYKFEAGTPSYVEAIGFGAAIKYLQELGMENVHAHEQAITAYALERLAEVPGIKVMGPDDASKKGAVAAMYMDGVHANDIAEMLDMYGVAVRAGHHCAQPLHACYNVQSSARASFYLYNSFEEVDALIDALYKVKTILGV